MTKGDLESQFSEVDIVAACNSPHVVQIEDLFEDVANLYIVQEYIEG